MFGEDLVRQAYVFSRASVEMPNVRMRVSRFNNQN